MDGVQRVAKNPIFADPDRVIGQAKMSKKFHANEILRYPIFRLPPDEKEFIELKDLFKREEENRKVSFVS